MNIRVTHIPRFVYKVMPWKNGLGSTTELLISPAGSTVQEGFDWRISLAQVPSTGPFSALPDYDRTIMLLRGDPMRLEHEGHGETLLKAFQPYAFDGAWNTTGVLTGQAVEDFNVMVRKGWGRAEVHVYRGTENIVLRHRRAELQFVWAFSGSAQIEIDDQTQLLLENESCLIENGPNLVLHMKSPSSIFVIVNISRTTNSGIPRP
jgi:environmental stress-induced protein Ves